MFHCPSKGHTANCLCNGIKKKKKKALLEWQSRQPPPSGQLAFNVTQQQSSSADSYGRAMCGTLAESQSLPPHLLLSGFSVGGLPPSLSHLHPCEKAYLSERASVANEMPGDIEPTVQKPWDKYSYVWLCEEKIQKQRRIHEQKRFDIISGSSSRSSLCANLLWSLGYLLKVAV